MTIEPAGTVDDTGAASLAPAAVADQRPAPTVGGSRLSTRFWLATIGAASVVGLALALMFLAPLAALSDLTPALVAAATLCVALLARLRAPGLAWASLVVSSLVAATIPISFSRAADPGAMELGQWLVVAGRSTYAAIVTLVIAALYATRPERQAAWRVTTLAMVLVAWLSAGCVVIVLLVVNGARADPRLTWVDIATRPTALFVDAVLLLAAFGVAGDVRAAALRADARLGVAGGGGLAPRQVPIPERVRATLRELVPGEADAGAAAVDAERLRLAGDLHAVVLPSLRRAIAEVEGGGPVEALADRLRAVDLELERLMADRWPLVLESFGLVEALEDLAERTEAGAGVQVGLEIEGDSGRPRPDVERTAWRIAQVALDNAIRHAAAEVVTLTVSVAPDRVTLQIADDGQGIDPATAAGAVRSGARGLADLARRASAVGGSVAVAPGAAGGTVVRFDWPA
jgi:signal transduction histidine kinase